MMMAGVGRGLLLAVLLLAGCGPSPCPPGVSHHDTFTDVVSSSASLACADMGSCDSLCMELAMRYASGHVEVQSCMRIDADGGADGADAGGQQQVTVDVSYLAFPFCGT